MPLVQFRGQSSLGDADLRASNSEMPVRSARRRKFLNLSRSLFRKDVTESVSVIAIVTWCSNGRSVRGQVRGSGGRLHLRPRLRYCFGLIVWKQHGTTPDISCVWNTTASSFRTYKRNCIKDASIRFFSHSGARLEGNLDKSLTLVHTVRSL